MSAAGAEDLESTLQRVVAGKMAESRLLMDGLSMMRQLGAIPARAAAI